MTVTQMFAEQENLEDPTLYQLERIAGRLQWILYGMVAVVLSNLVAVLIVLLK